VLKFGFLVFPGTFVFRDLSLLFFL